MPSNIEVKARVKHPEKLQALVKTITQTPGQSIKQEDIFFRVPKGRLKLRRVLDSPSELIYYHRENVPAPKVSQYIIWPVDKPDILETILISALGLLEKVRKERTLYRIGPTRIHLDRVESLGNFLELEVVLAEIQPPTDPLKMTFTLMEALKIQNDDLISGAYLDLLIENKE